MRSALSSVVVLFACFGLVGLGFVGEGGGCGVS